MVMGNHWGAKQEGKEENKANFAQKELKKAVNIAGVSFNLSELRE